VLDEDRLDLLAAVGPDKTKLMKTSSSWSRRTLAGLWLMMPACGAFSGGQSGTDSLEVVGVHDGTKCEIDGVESNVGEVYEEECQRCRCAPSGEWECEPIECADEPAEDANQGPGNPTDSGSLPPSSASIVDEPAGSSTPAENTGAPDTGALNTEATPTDCVTEVDFTTGGSSATYVAKDEQALVCLDAPTATSLCMHGSTAPAGESYMYWGGGFGLVFSTPGDGGVTPFDAASLGIERVRFSVTGLDGFVVRSYLNQVDDPAIGNPTNNYVQNSFVLVEMNQDATYELELESARLPTWTMLDRDEDGTPDTDAPLDPSRLNSLQFFVASMQDVGFDFEVCVSDFAWLDGDGQVVVP
jgi:hypothetical protein